MKYIKYFIYILKHKYYILKECWKRGLYWHGITHDLSKFLPDEFFAYVDWFYGKYGKNFKKCCNHYACIHRKMNLFYKGKFNKAK